MQYVRSSLVLSDSSEWTGYAYMRRESLDPLTMELIWTSLLAFMQHGLCVRAEAQLLKQDECDPSVSLNAAADMRCTPRASQPSKANLTSMILFAV